MIGKGREGEGVVLMVGAGVPALVLRKPGRQWDRELARNGKEECHGQGARVLSGLPSDLGPSRAVVLPPLGC